MRAAVFGLVVPVLLAGCARPAPGAFLRDLTAALAGVIVGAVFMLLALALLGLIEWLMSRNHNRNPHEHP